MKNVFDGVLLWEFGMKVEVGHFADWWYLEDVPVEEEKHTKKEIYWMLLQKLEEDGWWEWQPSINEDATGEESAEVLP